MFGRRGIEYKTDEQIRKMRVAGLVVARCLSAARDAGVSGATTGDLNDVVATIMQEENATPSFLGYGEPGFPGVICTSVNEEIVHGIPGKRTLRAGDLVSVDCGAIVDGWHGDAAISFIVPGDAPSDVLSAREKLSTVTRESLWAGIAAAATGSHVNDVGAAIEDTIPPPFEIVEDYTGHGIGTSMHMAPDVHNYAVQGRTPALKRGLCIAIEPMITAGSQDSDVLDDQWTVVTSDRSDAAHWEHTVALTSEGLWVLTAEDGGTAELAARGVSACPW